MSSLDCFLSVDVGTSAARAVLFDADLNQVAMARKHYPMLAPHRGWSEQEPEVVFDAVLGAMREVTGSAASCDSIRGVSFSSQLHSVLAVDAAGRPLTNSLIWSDTRSGKIARSFGQDKAAQGVAQRTGCPVDAIYPLAKIGWLKQHVDLPADVRFVSIKEYVIFKLSGQWLADWSIASGTGLFDVREHRWDERALSLLDIASANLSELVSPRYVVTPWAEGMSDLMGLPPGAQLVVGGGDGPLASIGVGAFDSKTLAVNVGTSAAARVIVREPQVDPQGSLWTYVVDEGLWVIGGIVSSGGMVYDWLLRNLFSGTEESDDGGLSGQVHQRAERLAANVPAGAENLLFLPYLGGEQSPDWHPRTRGSFFGLGFVHDRGHLIRAVLEGITRSVHRVALSIESLLNTRFEEIRVTGGFTSSPTWLQIVADMFGSPVLVLDSAEGSARGAAMLAMVAVGARANLEDLADLVAVRERIEPTEETHALYESQYRKFLQLLELARSLEQDGEV